MQCINKLYLLSVWRQPPHVHPLSPSYLPITVLDGAVILAKHTVSRFNGHCIVCSVDEALIYAYREVIIKLPHYFPSVRWIAPTGCFFGLSYHNASSRLVTYLSVGTKPLHEVIMISYQLHSMNRPQWTWWRHQMETFSALLAICLSNSSVTGGFPPQRPVTRSFVVFFDLRLNKRLHKQSWGWWFETPLRPLWRHCMLTT